MLTISRIRMTQRMVQCTTVRKTLRTPPGAWACRRTWDATVGQDEDEYWAAGSPTTSSPNRRTDESGTRNRTPELSSCPSL